MKPTQPRSESGALLVDDAPPYTEFGGLIVAWNTFNAHGGRTTHHAVPLAEETAAGLRTQEVHTHHFLVWTPDGWVSHVKADWRHRFGEHRFRRDDVGHLSTAGGRPVYTSTFPASCPPETFD